MRAYAATYKYDEYTWTIVIYARDVDNAMTGAAHLGLSYDEIVSVEEMLP